MPVDAQVISLKDLEFLTALARRKHFARAAEDCGVSQPAFSMRIRRIEESLGLEIVKRGNRFQGFTAEGQSLLRHAYKIVDDLKVMEQDILSAKGQISGAVTVGVIPTAVVYAAQAIKQLQSAHPGIRITLQTATALAIQQGVDSGEFEAGFTYGEGLSHDLLRVDELYQESYVLLAPSAFVPHASNRITWSDAAELPLCLLEQDMQNRRIIDKMFADLGLVPEVMTTSSGFLASIVLASEGMTATIIPDRLVTLFDKVSGIVALRLVEPELAKPVCLISRRRELSLPAVDALRSVCSLS